MLQVTFKEIAIVPKKRRFRIKQEKSYRVHLQDKSNNILPIYIEEQQAGAIIRGTDLVPSPKRPLTHDLFANVLTDWSLDLEKVTISGINDNDIYIASLIFRQGDTTKEIDCRPSDAIALALRLDCPIFVAETLMSEKAIAA